jgi:hypothetical protein
MRVCVAHLVELEVGPADELLCPAGHQVALTNTLLPDWWLVVSPRGEVVAAACRERVILREDLARAMEEMCGRSRHDQEARDDGAHAA